MDTTLQARLVAGIRAHGWWIAPQPIVIAILSVTVGLWAMWIVYALFNSAGIFAYIDRYGGRNRRRQTAFKLLAALLVPSGFLAFVLTGGGASPRDKVGAGSDDPKVRQASAAASGPLSGHGNG